MVFISFLILRRGEEDGVILSKSSVCSLVFYRRRKDTFSPTKNSPQPWRRLRTSCLSSTPFYPPFLYSLPSLSYSFLSLCLLPRFPWSPHETMNLNFLIASKCPYGHCSDLHLSSRSYMSWRISPTPRVVLRSFYRGVFLTFPFSTGFSKVNQLWGGRTVLEIINKSSQKNFV